MKPLILIAAFVCSFFHSPPSMAAGARTCERSLRPGGRAAWSKDFPKLAEEIEKRLLKWSAPTKYKVTITADSDPTYGVTLKDPRSIPERLHREAKSHAADGFVFDLDSPETVTVYRGLRDVRPEDVDVDQNRSNYVTPKLDAAVGYAGGGRNNVVLEFKLPAFLLTYNRDNYYIDSEKLARFKIDSPRIFLNRMGRLKGRKIEWCD